MAEIMELKKLKHDTLRKMVDGYGHNSYRDLPPDTEKIVATQSVCTLGPGIRSDLGLPANPESGAWVVEIKGPGRIQRAIVAKGKDEFIGMSKRLRTDLGFGEEYYGKPLKFELSSGKLIFVGVEN